MGESNIIIRMDNFWYVLNPETSSVVKHPLMNNVETPVGCGCVTLGSKIYFIGGKYSAESSRNMMFFDVSSDRWEVGKEMNAERIDPIVVATAEKSEKLYVFGGCTVSPWSECYDLEKDTWSPLADPPTQVTSISKRSGHLVKCCLGQIVIWDPHLFCLYDINKDIWTYVSLFSSDIPRFEMSGISTRVAVLNQYLFWFYGRQLFAYDLTQTEAYMHPIGTLDTNLNPPLDDCYQDVLKLPYLFATNGDEVCFLWPDTDRRICVWEIIEIGRCTVYGPLSAFSKDWGEFPLEGSGSISHCFAMLPEDRNKPQDDHEHNERYQGPVANLKNLSRTMYMNNYFSYVANRDEDDQSVKASRAKISLEKLVSSLGLEEYWEPVLEKIIDKNALNSLKEEDLEGLYNPAGTGEKTTERKLEDISKGKEKITN